MTGGSARQTARKRDFSAEAFRAWEKRHGFNWQRSAKELGCDKNTIYRWRKDGAPYHIGLACAAIDHGLSMPDVDTALPGRSCVAPEDDPDYHPDLVSSGRKWRPPEPV